MGRFTIGWLIIIGVLAMVLPFVPLHPQSQLAKAQASEPKSCKIFVVFDGDTLGCDTNENGKIDNKSEHIRLIGVNTPETHYSRKNTTGQDQPYAKQAVEFVKQSVLKKTVYLAYDIAPRDKYNRILAYVYLDKAKTQMLNQILLENGLATTYFMGADRQFETAFEKAQQQAQQKQLNLWKPTP